LITGLYGLLPRSLRMATFSTLCLQSFVVMGVNRIGRISFRSALAFACNDLGSAFRTFFILRTQQR